MSNREVKTHCCIKILLKVFDIDIGYFFHITLYTNLRLKHG